MGLTTKQIEAARHSMGPERIHDGNGLYLRLFAGGAKVFELRHAQGGKPGWVTLGRFPEIGLRRARDLAGAARLMLERGIAISELRALLKRGDIAALEAVFEEPGEAMPVATAMPSFRELAKIWFEQKKLGLRNGKHIQQNWNTIETYVFPHFGDRRIDEITVADVIAAIKPIWHCKHETARRTLGRTKEIFALAKIKELRADNPADFSTRIALGRVRCRKGHFGALAHEQMPEFWDWLQNVRCECQTRQLAMLLILSAKRTKETRLAQWDFFDSEAAIWTTPEELMKMGRNHRVPLSRQMAVVLDNMSLLTGDHRQIFAKPGNRSGVVSENTVLNLVKRFDPGITGHGFRATFKTWARRQKRYEADAIEFALAHEQDALEAAYQREDLLEEREQLMQDWADYVTGGRDPVRLRDLASG
ncbi:tyrosine-type recombinase/integrase [Thioclava sp.]|uniref:tyrosine-type recombinase/integrase n=1 Tax=Thioclava sp. TaxID=1933450 RepID=UPI003AA98F7E